MTELIGPDVRLLFVGISPASSTTVTRGPFGRRGNRFCPALFRAGITDRLIDASDGVAPSDRDHLLARGVGITSLVARATGSAAELGADELVAGAAALRGRGGKSAPADLGADMNTSAVGDARNSTHVHVGASPAADRSG